MLLTVLGLVFSVAVSAAQTAVPEENELLGMMSQGGTEPTGDGSEESLGLCIVYGLLTVFAILFALGYPRRRNMRKQRKK